ncbi:MAG TPA: glycosyl hydrolase family 65 protein, partial [Ktedonobacteraceae bacterium]|nr:glycosyl hydrolase family 65 protein [Ktedonobacteraceae bacterium]
ASLAGAWTALVAGFGGLRSHDGAISFAPRLPDGIKRLAFHLMFRGRRLCVEVMAGQATYHLLAGSPLKTWHHGNEITLSNEKAITRPIPAIKPGPRPSQPPGREPLPRSQRKSLA